MATTRANAEQGVRDYAGLTHPIYYNNIEAYRWIAMD
jgi:hypothetical protein